MKGNRFTMAMRVATTLAIAEILLVMIVTLRQAPPEGALYAGLMWSVVKCAPLIILLPGLVRGSPRAATWFCFVLCAYFTAAVATAAAPSPLRNLALLETILVGAGFIAGLLATRWGRGLAEPQTRIS